MVLRRHVRFDRRRRAANVARNLRALQARDDSSAWSAAM
jgi:hypothetical protein